LATNSNLRVLQDLAGIVCLEDSNNNNSLRQVFSALSLNNLRVSALMQTPVHLLDLEL